jgi:hypothetical protein
MPRAAVPCDDLDPAVVLLGGRFRFLDVLLLGHRTIKCTGIARTTRRPDRLLIVNE